MPDDNEKTNPNQNEISQAVDIHREVAEEAISTGFGIFGTPGKPGESQKKEE